MAGHDLGYKALFSSPRMVEDLLVGFLPESWVSKVELSSLEKISGSYTGDILVERNDDVVWRVRSKQNQGWIYLYFLIEFQSTVAYFMAVRIMVYVALLYQDLIAQKLVLPGQLLPRIEPIVLYNGNEAWGAAENIQEMIQPVEGFPDEDRPSCRYRLVAENTYPRERLEELQNVAATLFLLEQSRGPEDIIHGIDRLLEELKDEPQLRRAFLVWMRQVLLPGRMPGAEVSELNSLHEVKNMLAERVKEWTQEWKREGFKEGYDKGVGVGFDKGVGVGFDKGVGVGFDKGVGEGQISLTQRMIEKRFGPLNAEQIARVQASDPETLLERWLTAASLEDVLGD